MESSPISKRTTWPTEMFSLSVVLSSSMSSARSAAACLALLRHELGELVGEVDEGLRLGHEVGLAPQLDDGGVATR